MQAVGVIMCGGAEFEAIFDSNEANITLYPEQQQKKTVKKKRKKKVWRMIFSVSCVTKLLKHLKRESKHLL